MSEPQSWHGKWMSTPEGGRGWTASRWGHQGRGSIKYKPCQMENRSSVIQSVADADVIYQFDQSVSSSLPSPVPEMLTNHMLPPFHQNACLQKQPSTKKKQKTAKEAQKPIVTMCDFRAMWFHGGVRAFQWLPVVIGYWCCREKVLTGLWGFFSDWLCSLSAFFGSFFTSSWLRQTSAFDPRTGVDVTELWLGEAWPMSKLANPWVRWSRVSIVLSALLASDFLSFPLELRFPRCFRAGSDVRTDAGTGKTRLHWNKQTKKNKQSDRCKKDLCTYFGSWVTSNRVNGDEWPR